MLPAIINFSLLHASAHTAGSHRAAVPSHSTKEEVALKENLCYYPVAPHPPLRPPTATHTVSEYIWGDWSGCPLTLHQRGGCSEREPVLWSSRPSSSFSPCCNAHCVRVWGDWSTPSWTTAVMTTATVLVWVEGWIQNNANGESRMPWKKKKACKGGGEGGGGHLSPWPPPGSTSGVIYNYM